MKQTVTRFFDGMRTAGSNLIKSTLAPTIVFQTIMQKKNGSTSVETEKMQEFIAAVTQPHPQVYDERVTFDVIKIDAALATVWALYTFYVGSTFSHCGVDAFQLVKLNGNGESNTPHIDTRCKEACP